MGGSRTFGTGAKFFRTGVLAGRGTDTDSSRTASSPAENGSDVHQPWYQKYQGLFFFAQKKKSSCDWPKRFCSLVETPYKIVIEVMEVGRSFLKSQKPPLL